MLPLFKLKIRSTQATGGNRASSLMGGIKTKLSSSAGADANSPFCFLKMTGS